MSKRIFILFTILLPSIALHSQWIETLPANIQSEILWSADHEEGNMNDWTLDQYTFPGGGIFNTGGADVFAMASDIFAHSGSYSAESIITNAWQAQNGPRAVRLMRWTDTAWDNGGMYFPTESYYSAYYYFPITYNPNKYQPWDPGDGGWWNIFQFKSHDANGVSQPVWTLNVEHDDVTQEMSLYLYSNENIPHSNSHTTPMPIPVGKWVHLEAFYHASTPNVADGQIIIWQDGIEILNVPDVVTTLDDGVVVWGIGNYTDHIDGDPMPGKATVYFDDAIVSETAIHPYVSCTTFAVNHWIGSNNSNWQDPLNWSSGFCPIQCQTVIIPSGATVQVEPNTYVKIKELTVESNANLEVPSTTLFIVIDQ